MASLEQFILGNNLLYIVVFGWGLVGSVVGGVGLYQMLLVYVLTVLGVDGMRQRGSLGRGIDGLG